MCSKLSDFIKTLHIKLTCHIVASPFTKEADFCRPLNTGDRDRLEGLGA